MNKKFLPGEIILDNSDKIFTYGTGTVENKNMIKSTVYGHIKRHNKLIIADSLFNFRYKANIGDVIIGKITEIYNKKWKVDCNSINEATLSLGSVILPGVVQRIKGDEDEMEMRNLFSIGDLVVCEVQKVNKNGSFNLHTRSEKYGKLQNGFSMKIPTALIKKDKSFFKFDNFTVIVGSNGIIFLSTTDEYEKIAKIHREIKENVKNKKIIDFNLFFTDIPI